FDEPVRELIPGAGLSRLAGQEITLLDLATHHSGLPTIPASFRPANRADPVADFDVAKLYAYLDGRGVEKPPDAAFRYSNLGFGLLGHALSTRARLDRPIYSKMWNKWSRCNRFSVPVDEVAFNGRRFDSPTNRLNRILAEHSLQRISVFGLAR